MPKILVIEDNEEFRNAAEQYFVSRDDVEPIFAKDFDEAVQILDTEKDTLDGAIVDFFFPKSTGSGDVQIGRELVERLIEEDSKELNARDLYEEFRKYLDFSNEENALFAKKAAIYYANSIPPGGVSEMLMVKVLKKTYDLVGGKVASLIFKNAHPNVDQIKDHYGALERGLAESEYNQPLGLIIGEQLMVESLPFVFATSTYHHASTGQKIHDYANRNIGVPIIECGQDKENEKATTLFWEKAYTAFESTLKWFFIFTLFLYTFD